MQCWRCGHALTDLLLPLARAETCPACNADLHVCRMCTFFDKSVANACRETVAEPVKDKDRANFCGYLSLNQHAFAPGDSAIDERARAQLAELFGEESAASDTGSSSPTEEPEIVDPAELARRQFDNLFKK